MDKKNAVFYYVMPLLIFISLLLTTSSKPKLDRDKYSVGCLDLDYSVPNYTNTKLQVTTTPSFAIPQIGKTFVGFKEALAFKESRCNYFAVNTLGYLGKYQFGKSTLDVIGIHNTKAFLSNPELQEKAFIVNSERNKWILRRDIKQFVGKTIDGVCVTESGILAAAHLAGPGSVKKYLRSYGAIGFSDVYGASVFEYLKRFSGYDTSTIVGNKKARI